MMNRTIKVAGLILIMATSLQAVDVPENLPPINVTIKPQDPGTSPTQTLTLSGEWPDNCAPADAEFRVIDDNSLWIDLLLPGARTCDEPNCTPGPVAWQMNSDIASLASGLYEVYARAITCNETGSFERIATLQVSSGAGGDGNGGGPIPSEFAVGERVVLLENAPLGVSDLLSGQAGTIVCVGATDCANCLLISWDGWAGGRDDTSRCLAGDRPVLVAPESVMWVDPDVTLIGRHFNQCGTLVKGLEGCVLLQTDDGDMFNIVGDGWLSTSLDGKGPISFGDRARVRGALNTTRPNPNTVRICPQRDGDIYYPIVTPCVPAGGTGCCGGLRPGDRVVLLVDNPAGVGGNTAAGLPAGSTGTVVCCDSGDSLFPIFVSWDNWKQGTNDTVFCDPPIVQYAENSGRWMRCGQIRPVDGEPQPCPEGDLIISIGSRRVRLSSDQQCPDRTTFSGCTTVSLEANFRARLSVRVTPTTGVGGTWEGWVTPEIVGPGEATVTVCVRVTDLDLSTLPPDKDTPVASVSIFAVPAQ